MIKKAGPHLREPASDLRKLVGDTGIEPVTSSVSKKRYAPAGGDWQGVALLQVGHRQLGVRLDVPDSDVAGEAEQAAHTLAAAPARWVGRGQQAWSWSMQMRWSSPKGSWHIAQAYRCVSSIWANRYGVRPMSLSLYARFQRDLTSGVTVRARGVRQHLAGSLLLWAMLGSNQRPPRCQRGALPLRQSPSRRRRESNPRTGLCRPLPKPLGHSASARRSLLGKHGFGHPKYRAGQGPAGRNPAPPSGRRDSNPRPSPWQGDALPTEPRPHAGALPSGRVRPGRRAFRTVADPGPRANSDPRRAARHGQLGIRGAPPPRATRDPRRAAWPGGLIATPRAGRWPPSAGPRGDPATLRAGWPAPAPPGR